MTVWNMQDEEALLKNSAFDLLVGKCLGSGASRRVYELLHSPDLVMKVEYAGKTFNNQTEYLVWQEVRNWPISDWFAPIVEIDSYGNVLFQRRTEPFDSEKEFFSAITRTRGGVIPKVFDDIHYGNFGMLDGRVTCHDYGYHTFFEQVAREMSVEAGYITFDIDEPLPYDVTEGGQLALDI